MSFSSYLHANRVMAVGARSPVERRRRALDRVNKELNRGNYETALSLVKQLKGKHGDLRGFGSAKLLPKKLSTLNELEVRRPDLYELRPLIDSVTQSINRSIESASTEKSFMATVDVVNNLSSFKLQASLVCIMQISSDQNSLSTFIEDERKTSYEEDRFAVVQHESGHFIVGYLLGVLPRRYEIPKLEDLEQNVSEVTGRVEFVGFEFLKEVGVANQFMKHDVDSIMNQSATRGNISSKTLNNFSCVILGGLVTEHILFGYSEGLYSDVCKLTSVMQWLGFTNTEKESQIRWAATNTVSLIHSHSEARAALAEAMAKGKPVGACIDAIESAISRHQT